MSLTGNFGTTMSMPYESPSTSDEKSLDKKSISSTSRDPSRSGSATDMEVSERTDINHSLSDEALVAVTEEENDDSGWTEYQGYSPLISGSSSFTGPYSIEDPLNGTQSNMSNFYSIADESDEYLDEILRRKEIEDEKKIAQVMKALEFQMKALDTDYESCIASENHKKKTEDDKGKCKSNKNEHEGSPILSTGSPLNETVSLSSTNKKTENQPQEETHTTGEVSIDRKNSNKSSCHSGKTGSSKVVSFPSNSTSFPPLPGSIDIKTTMEPTKRPRKQNRNRFSKLKKGQIRREGELNLNLDTNDNNRVVPGISIAPVSPLSQEKANQIKNIMKGIHISEKAIPFWAKQEAQKNLKE